MALADLSTTPKNTDTIRILEIRILNALRASGAGSGGSGGAGVTGVGSPEGVVTAPPGTTYLDTSSDSLWFKKTGAGNTGWIQLIA